MKLKTHILIAIFFGFSFSLLADTPLFAGSRSATVRVSCTILPMIEISSAKTPSIKTNLGSDYGVTESIRKAGNDKIKLYSITAL